MAGGFGSKPSMRTLRRRASQGTMSDINMTPLVDVMLVLLVIFMVTAPLLTVGVPVDLPKTKATAIGDNIEPLTVSIDNEGRVYLQETQMDVEAMISRLKAITETKPDTRIFVRGDQKIPYGRIMEVVGAINAAGLKKVALITEMHQGKPSHGKKNTGHPG